MSDHIVKLIPDDPFYKPSDLSLSTAKAYLEAHVDCDCVNICINDTPVFVDCGSNLSEISCPKCGAELDVGWWQGAMSKAFEGEFMVLDTAAPCCGAPVSLNELCYKFPCGFARARIEIYNPGQAVEDDILDSVQKIFGTALRVIHVHL